MHTHILTSVYIQLCLFVPTTSKIGFKECRFDVFHLEHMVLSRTDESGCSGLAKLSSVQNEQEKNKIKSRSLHLLEQSMDVLAKWGSHMHLFLLKQMINCII